MDVWIDLTYKTPNDSEVIFNSDMMEAHQALIIADDLKSIGRASEIEFYDKYGGSWDIKQLRQQMETVKSEPHEIIVYFDGGFDRYTNKAGLGYAIYYRQNGYLWRLRQNALVDELGTNNEAEYAALHLEIRALDSLGVYHQSVTLAGDSQVVINQLKDVWPCFDAVLNEWADRIDDHLAFSGIEPVYELMSRKNNQEADWLASQALKGVDINSTMELS